MDLKPKRLSTVADIQVSAPRGPWTTKSNGTLSVISVLPHEAVAGFLTYDPDELAVFPSGFDIRGLRHYLVEGLAQGVVGGTEYHRIRQEWVITLQGGVVWDFKDVQGGVRRVTARVGEGVFIPPYILHTYTALSDGTALLAVANTLFDPNDRRTHDTYSADTFDMLRG